MSLSKQLIVLWNKLISLELTKKLNQIPTQAQQLHLVDTSL